MSGRVRDWLRERMPAPLRERYHRYAVRRDFGIGAGEDASRRREESRKQPPGLNVIGYLESPSGVGQSSRAVALAAEAAGLAVERIALSGSGRDGLARGAYDVNLYHVNAEGADSIVEELGPRLHAGHLNVAYWYWESDRFPARWRDRFAYFDEIWVASEFCRKAVAAASPIPVHVVPPAVVPPVPAARASTGGGRPGEVGFLTLLDALSVPERKNPVGTIRAFAEAFPGESGATLQVQVAHAERVDGLLPAMREAAQGARVTFGEGILSRDGLSELFASCDAYVSLHRAEGFGFPIAEAMSLGKAAVATDYSGSADFLDESTGFPVRWSPCALPESVRDYEAGTLWAEPDLRHAVETLRRVRDDAAGRERRGEAARRRIESLYSPRVSGERIRARLEALRAREGEGS